VLPHLDGVVIEENGQDGNAVQLDARPRIAQGLAGVR
jgi:hypothetical protein